MLSEALLKRILDFRKEREWEQFHNLRTLSTSIVLEAAELAEHTQWSQDSELKDVVRNKHQKIEEEIADLAILLSYLIHDLGLDLEDVVSRKLELNARKYPVKQAKGSAKKYDEID